MTRDTAAATKTAKSSKTTINLILIAKSGNKLRLRDKA